MSGHVPGVDAPPEDGGPLPLDSSSFQDDAHVDDPLDADEVPRVSIESPASDAHLRRASVIAGQWIARIEFSVVSVGVERVDLIANGTEIGSLTPPDITLFRSFDTDGEYIITALGLDSRGVTVATDEVRITISPPSDSSCHAMLDALGLEWEALGSLRGVQDPVRVSPLISGVRYRHAGDSEPRPMSMDCELAARLARLSDLVSTYGIGEIVHLGVYNYRCIGGGDPDSGTCTPSQHASARAIDLHAFKLRDREETWSTEDDFEITRRADDCPMMSSSDADRGLKDIACALWSEGIFQIVLTPNYNAAHRNHFHVDLSEGAMYLGAGVEGVDPPVEGLGD